MIYHHMIDDMRKETKRLPFLRTLIMIGYITKILKQVL